MQNLAGLFARLSVMIVAAPAVILALYACLFPGLHIKTYAGLAIGILSAAGIAFYWIGRTKGLAAAFTGSLAVAFSVYFLSMFLILNLLGS